MVAFGLGIDNKKFIRSSYEVHTKFIRSSYEAMKKCPNTAKFMVNIQTGFTTIFF
jgi:uncharacterized protein (UPF0303 family)